MIIKSLIDNVSDFESAYPGKKFEKGQHLLKMKCPVCTYKADPNEFGVVLETKLQIFNCFVCGWCGVFIKLNKETIVMYDKEEEKIPGIPICHIRQTKWTAIKDAEIETATN